MMNTAHGEETETFYEYNQPRNMLYTILFHSHNRHNDNLFNVHKIDTRLH